jgi:glycosidase
MINIYQLFPRVFGNKTTTPEANGSIQTNGCGKFSDIDNQAITAIRDLGITHVWLTGIIRHATLTSYEKYGIPDCHPGVVKGRAGSPYAITDYYDVDPDLATNVDERLQEFKALVKRLHQQKLKVIIDFVGNHVSRQYQSIAKPTGTPDFGEFDNKEVVFAPTNNFYYLPGQALVLPVIENKITDINSHAEYHEMPARVTGNDCFRADPASTDWYETVKLNYGIDFTGEKQTFFDPPPPTWNMMLDILKYWAQMGVDGFEATRLIKTIRPDLPVLGLTAYGQSGDERKVRDAGCDAYLAKPFKSAELVRIIEGLLSGRVL